ncbi:MAG: IS91 family transposase [Thermodesulfobacteriota bacterium]
MAAMKATVEVADILRAHIGDYQKQYKLHPDHYKVVYDIMNCRTEYLGGHVERCDHCGVERTLYNSCRNRHCPKCQTLTKEKWLAARKAELLKVAYFHVVFTLPHEFNPVILCNKRVILTILFQAVSATLLAFGRNPENGLGGTIGFIAVLHTWDQQLNDHFHLHCLVPAGALSANGKNRGQANNCIFPSIMVSNLKPSKKRRPPYAQNRQNDRPGSENRVPCHVPHRPGRLSLQRCG